MSKAFKTLKEVELDLVVKSGLIQQLKLRVQELEFEIERLNKGYCPIKEKCNKGECDCTNEEYNQMCEENMKLDLEIERLNNIIDEFDKYLVSIKNSCIYNVDVFLYKVVSNIYNKFKELKGVELTGNDKKQVKWLKEEFNVGSDKE